MDEPIDRNGIFVTCNSRFGAACIDLHDGEDVAQWCNCFGLPEERLRLIVSKVGPMANAVHAYLNSKGYGS